MHSSNTGRAKQQGILRQLVAYEGPGHIASIQGRTAWLKRMQRSGQQILLACARDRDTAGRSCSVCFGFREDNHR